MNREDFIIAAALILFASFLLGWFASWVIGRMTRPTSADRGAMDRMAQAVAEAESERDRALERLAAQEAESTAARALIEDDLRERSELLSEAQQEIEELRAYIDKRLSR
ncbi:MAG: hypothetical protein Q4F71_04305 [Paracoccus sp. (in: a-proteobacteria)]|nr:hypothetical protein [Paracoccus sp. (in: a-proteobacteria)]